MNEIELFDRLKGITALDQQPIILGNMSELAKKVTEHKIWLKNIRHEHPNPNVKFNVGIYIRYFNQTKYDNYLYYHKKQFTDTIDLCPNWTLVDFYIDEGSTAPNMETAPEWSRLLQDCMDGKVDLIITQKVSNVSKKYYEVAFCSRLLASLEKPIGIYFISEDIYTLASYYLNDLKDTYFLPSNDWQILPETELLGQNGND